MHFLAGYLRLYSQDGDLSESKKSHRSSSASVSMAPPRTTGLFAISRLTPPSALIRSFFVGGHSHDLFSMKMIPTPKLTAIQGNSLISDSDEAKIVEGMSQYK